MITILNKLLNYEQLNKEESHNLLFNITRGKYNDAQIASLITIYLMRNISLDELFERKDKEFENTITKTKTILSSFSSQLTNLSPAQCKVLLVYLVLLGLWVIYSFGYAIGKFIAYIE